MYVMIITLILESITIVKVSEPMHHLSCFAEANKFNVQSTDRQQPLKAECRKQQKD